MKFHALSTPIVQTATYRFRDTADLIADLTQALEAASSPGKPTPKNKPTTSQVVGQP